MAHLLPEQDHLVLTLEFRSEEHLLDHPEDAGAFLVVEVPSGELIGIVEGIVAASDAGRPAAVLVNPRELVDLEDALALARYRERQAAGGGAITSHGDVRARLGLERE